VPREYLRTKARPIRAATKKRAVGVPHFLSWMDENIPEQAQMIVGEREKFHNPAFSGFLMVLRAG
jgi:hypothetical protein